MIVINTPVSPYLQNAPIVYCDKTKKSIFVDPGDAVSYTHLTLPTKA